MRKVVFILALLITVHAYAQRGNTEIPAAVVKQDLDALLKFYSDDAIILPEFHTSVIGKKNIKAYYANWFRQAAVSNYTRTMHDYKQVDEYIVETGTFSYTLAMGKGQTVYTGNYLVVWKGDKHGKLHIVREMWGSDKSVDRKLIEVPASGAQQVVKTEPTAIRQTEMVTQVLARTSEIETAVKKRDGISLGKLYTRDAIYIPYYSPMMIGAEKIKDYYIKHEDPQVVIDSIDIKLTSVIEIKSILIVTGVYRVDWKAGEQAGTVYGKNLNVWRRQKDSRYYLFRQMANHD